MMPSSRPASGRLLSPAGAALDPEDLPGEPATDRAVLVLTDTLDGGVVELPFLLLRGDFDSITSDVEAHTPKEAHIDIGDPH